MTMNILKSGWLSLAFRVIVGGFFIYAAVDKIIHPGDFAKMVYNYRLLPGSLVNIFALILPWLELLCGIALIVGTRVEGAAAIVSALLVVFIIAVAIAISRGIKIDCGCFSTSPGGARKVGLPLILQDLALLLMALHVWVRGAGRWALEKARA